MSNKEAPLETTDYTADLETLANGQHIDVFRVATTGFYPVLQFVVPAHRECAVYPLIGEFDLIVHSGVVVPMGGRRHITEDPTPSWHGFFDSDTNLHFRAVTMSFDCIVVVARYENPAYDQTSQHHLARAITRDVGTGSYRRQVTDMHAPVPSRMHIGETMSWNDGIRGGCWSSWPPHATPNEVLKDFANHEEYFLVITPTYGIMCLDGKLTDGQVIQRVQRLENNDFYQVPLGSHSVCFHPREGPAWGWYLWVYDSFLRKTYNSHAHHVGVYVR
jgi:5-deoxy-D-glucuronate isomerase